MDSSEFGIDERQSSSPSTAPAPGPEEKRGGHVTRSSIGGGAGGNQTNYMGKHRMAAAISHLHQQIQIIQEELEQLETMGESSLVCKETRGPADIGWDRWFQGAHSSRNRKRWI